MKTPLSATSEAIAKQAIQLGSVILWSLIIGLSIGLISGKFIFNSSEKPKFNDPLIARILCKPSNVKCSLLFISSEASEAIIFLNKIKSPFF
jgi:hypothetical protein